VGLIEENALHRRFAFQNRHKEIAAAAADVRERADAGEVPLSDLRTCTAVCHSERLHAANTARLPRKWGMLGVDVVKPRVEASDRWHRRCLGEQFNRRDLVGRPRSEGARLDAATGPGAPRSRHLLLPRPRRWAGHDDVVAEEELAPGAQEARHPAPAGAFASPRGARSLDT
jgi:hypothetical protein